MPLIKSISGIRGTIGSLDKENLTPANVLKFTSAYGEFIKKSSTKSKTKVIVGRDSRVSGLWLSQIVTGALLALGIDVIDLGMAATPTVAMAVLSQSAQGGIIISASHNPSGWNALKLLNSSGEFLSKLEGESIIDSAESNGFNYVSEDESGTYLFNPYLEWDHINRIAKLALVDKDLVAKQNYKIVVDGINSIGAKAIGHTLEMLGVSEQIIINDSLDGNFAHNPEPLESNLGEIMERVKSEGADLGIVVDPDVDRLVFIDEEGKMFGEEYTLVVIADYILANFSEIESFYPDLYELNTVSNLSSSRALADVTKNRDGKYEAAAVGEVNVVDKMKEVKAVIGGEGNGGIIYSPLHYGRDALVGVALFLTHLAKSGKKVSDLRDLLPEYHMVKDKLVLETGVDIAKILTKLKAKYNQEEINEIDGLKIDFADCWAHIRSSNTEPILRIYTEAKTKAGAVALSEEIKNSILSYIS